MTAAVELTGVGKVFRAPPEPWRWLLGRPPRPVTVALRAVDLQIRAGEALGLVGPNGAGKSVLVKLIATLVEPSHGTVRVLGRDAVTDARAVRRSIGLAACDERSFYWRLTGRQNLTFFARLHGLDRRAAAARIGALAEQLDLQPLLARPYMVLSAGNRQRLAIARALLAEPRVLLLDEPTRSLDAMAAARLRELLARWLEEDRQRAVLFTTHDLEEVAELCARVAVLDRGELLECTELAGLQARYGAGETVALRLREVPRPALLERLRAVAADLTCRGTTVRFRRAAGDETLQGVLEMLAAAGARVADCRARGESLKELFGRVLAGRSSGA